MSRIGKLIAVLLVGLSWAPTSALADDNEEASSPTITPTASLVTRYEVRKDYTPGAMESSDFIRYRARFGLNVGDLRINDNFTANVRFVPQAGGFWHVGGDGLEDPSLGLHEGVLQLASANCRVDIGRFEMAYGEHLVIGTVGWHHLARAFDGARWHRNLGDSGAYIDVFLTALSEGFTEGAGANLGAADQYFAGIYTDIGPILADGLALDLYLLPRIWVGDDDAETDTAAELTFGVRSKNRFGDFDYRAEAGVQFGSRQAAAGEDNPSVMAFQGDVEVGLSFGDARVGLEGFFASGDDPETEDAEGWDQLFPTGHKWLGVMDLVGGRTNVMGAVVHLLYKVNPQWRISIDGHMFMRAEVPEGADSTLGYEIDNGVVYLIGGGLKLRLGFDIFIYANDDAPDDTPWLTEVELSFNL